MAKKTNISGTLILVAIVAVAAMPKEVWIVLGIWVAAYFLFKILGQKSAEKSSETYVPYMYRDSPPPVAKVPQAVSTPRTSSYDEPVLHGRLGEKFVNHYSFYAAFASDEEYRIVSAGRQLGTLPVTQMLTIGQRILFAGRTWLVEEVDEPQKTIHVVKARGGVPPLFSGGAGRVHSQVRMEMRRLLESRENLPYLDSTAQQFLAEGREAYEQKGLSSKFYVDQGSEVVLLTWLGDAANEAISCLFGRRGYTASLAGPGIEVMKGQMTTEDILNVLADVAVDEPPSLNLLLQDAQNLQRQKWDWALPDDLLRRAYASQYLNLNEAMAWTKIALNQ